MPRVLIVDDSPTFRGVLRGILAAAQGVEVVGEAADGEEAIGRTLELRPEVITMDVRMPRRNGLDAIREIMRIAPTPIVVVSAAARDASEAVTFEALKLGALEVLEKPQALDAHRYNVQAESIRQAVRAAAGVKLATRHRDRGERRPEKPAGPAAAAGVAAAPNAPWPGTVTAAAVKPSAQPLQCIGIAASTGGPAALQKVFSTLPADFPVPIVVVQHIAEGFSAGLVHWLADSCPLKVKLAERGEAVERGKIYVAPDGHHMLVSMGRIRLDDSPPLKSLRPSATVLFASMAREYGPAAAGFVLTGMGDDGAAGLKLMRDRGAFTAAQGKLSSVVFGMPHVALETGAADLALELDEIVPAMVKLVGERGPAAQPQRRRKLLLVDDAETILQLEKALLSESYELVFAHNGREAVEAALKHLPDGILMDHSMPQMTGAEALKQIKAGATTRAIPVIMVSSETEKGIVQSWWTGGCQAVVAKPIDTQLLLGTVRKYIPLA